jgi:hypothetical protein
MNRQIILVGLLVLAAVAGVLIYRAMTPAGRRTNHVWEFLSDPAVHEAWKIPAGTRCGEAPFIFPTTGMAGFLWGDSFRIGHSHQGIDIFAGTPAGITPVVAAYDGYLTRLSTWKSSVIMRVPDDPLSPGRQIWLYYTHMADRDGTSYIADAFPAGTSEVFVPAGTFLGYQGDYSGDPTHRQRPLRCTRGRARLDTVGNGHSVMRLTPERRPVDQSAWPTVRTGPEVDRMQPRG